MKLLFLNAWQGTVKSKIDNFIREKSLEIDFFCFQEAAKSKKWLFKDLLADYRLVTDDKYISNSNKFFQATYINKAFEVKQVTTLLKKELDTGLVLCTSFQFGNKILTVCNVHGIATPGNKMDTAGRLKQSEEIIDFLKKIDGPKIVGGDFNLEFDTQSVKMFEKNGYRNLIKEYKIKTTRNRLSWERFPKKQYFADYVFVSSDVKVLNFSVPNIEISDHLPQILEIE